MARARNIKPAFFKNETLVELPVETRLLFIGLWTLADREGRLEDRPKRIKMEIYPADEFNVDSMLNQLCSGGFLLRYEVEFVRYIEIINFVKHQDPHYREKASEIPPPPGADNKIVANGVTRTQRARILERDGHKCMSCGSTEHLCIDHVAPVSKGGTSADDNLQVLCLPCNTKKGNKLASEFSTSSRSRVDVESKRAHDVPLIPDSLIPDSLIPDSLNKEGGKADGEGGDWQSNQPPTARDGEFPMDLSWEPSDHFPTLARQAGAPAPTAEAVAEFRSYWIGQGAAMSQHQWDHKLLTNLKAQKLRGGQAPPGRANARASPGQPRTLSEGRAAAAKAIFNPGPAGQDDGHERRTIDVTPPPSAGLGAKALR